MLQSTDRASARILIVDDQLSNVRLLEQTLRRAGYAAVMTTTEPRDVEALQQEHRYDLILLDLQMPELNGFGVMKLLLDGGQADPPAILVMSADPSQKEAAVKAGARSFLGKPFRLADVVARVELELNAARQGGLGDSST